MIGIIGKKLGMTQIFNAQGQQIPCTVVEATPNPVVQVTTAEHGRAPAVQLGYGTQKVRRDSKKGERTPRGRRGGCAPPSRSRAPSAAARTRAPPRRSPPWPCRPPS